MTSPWFLATPLIIPGLLGLALLMNWLEVYFTYRQVADEVAVAWQSVDSPDELEQAVIRSVQRVLAAPR